jgi:NAD-dependent DNA ligase
VSYVVGRAQALQAQRKVEQGLAEMVGLVRGVIADGRVSEDEAHRLSEWTRENPEVATRYPANLLARRLERIFMDGRVDGREKKRLASMLAQLAENPTGFGGGYPLATDLPLTRPEPEVTFEGQTFVFGGDMAYGPLHACEREVMERGGVAERTVNRRTDYVVIGQLAANDWCQSAFGGLIDQVVEYRSRGVPIAVITEDHWADALD